MTRVPEELADHPSLDLQVDDDMDERLLLLRHVLDDWLDLLERNNGFTHRAPAIADREYPMDPEELVPVGDLYDREDEGFVVGYGRAGENLVEWTIPENGEIVVDGELLDLFGEMIRCRYEHQPTVRCGESKPRFGGWANRRRGVLQVEPVLVVDLFAEALRVGDGQDAIYSISDQWSVNPPKWDDPDT